MYLYVTEERKGEGGNWTVQFPQNDRFAGLDFKGHSDGRGTYHTLLLLTVKGSWNSEFQKDEIWKIAGTTCT